MKNHKITIKQTYALFVLAVLSPLIRLASVMTARFGGLAGWVALIISCAVFYGFVSLLGLCFKNRESFDLYGLYKSAFGTATAKTITFAYMLWVFALAAFYLRIFSERFAGVIMPGVPAGFFTVTLLALVYIILSGRLHSFALLGNIFFYVALIAVAGIFLLQIPKISPANLLPVTFYDGGNIFNAVFPPLAIFGYITPLMFLGSEIEDKNNNFNKHGLYASLTLLAASLAIFAVTVGVFGSDLTQKMPQPFLTSVKTIGVLDSLERLESAFLLLWVVTDLALIVMLMYVFIRLFGFLTGGGEKTAVLKTPLLSGIYIFSLFLVKGERQAESLSLSTGIPVNIIMGFILPLIGVGFWAIRRYVSKRL